MGFLKYVGLFIAIIGYHMVLVIRQSEKSTWKHILYALLIMFGGFILFILANELSNK